MSEGSGPRSEAARPPQEPDDRRREATRPRMNGKVLTKGGSDPPGERSRASDEPHRQEKNLQSAPERPNRSARPTGSNPRESMTGGAVIPRPVGQFGRRLHHKAPRSWDRGPTRRVGCWTATASATRTISPTESAFTLAVGWASKAAPIPPYGRVPAYLLRRSRPPGHSLQIILQPL